MILGKDVGTRGFDEIGFSCSFYGQRGERGIIK